MKKSSVSLIILIFMLGCNRLDEQNNLNAKDYSVIHSVEFKETKQYQLLWEGIFFITGASSNTSPCLSKNGVLFLHAKDSINEDYKLFAINSLNGEVLWKKEYVNTIELEIIDNNIAVGSGTSIILFEGNSGRMIWETNLFGVRNIEEIFYFKDILYVSGSGISKFMLEPIEGSVIDKESYIDEFREDYSDVPFVPSFPFKQIIHGDLVISQNGNIVYGIFGENFQTNEIVWYIEENVISNIAILNENIFWISDEDQIHSFSLMDNTSQYIATIYPSIDFYNFDKNPQHKGYFLCADDENDILFVILGDSNQIFAFEESE